MKFMFMSAGHLWHVRGGQSLRRLTALSALIFGLSLAAFGQEATIVGTVTDPSGSVVPKVNITVTNTETGQVRAITTGESGQYVVPDLHIGTYSVKAEVSGFKVAERKNVVLNVGDRARLDFQMTMGTAQETVTVEAEAIRVQSDSGEVSSVITGQQINQLATNGRSMYSLASLTPGASSGQGDFQTPTPVGGDANISYNGLRMSHNLYMLDGSESSDRGGGGGSDVMPSLDSLQEFRMLTSNYSAEFGLSSGATLTAVVKSGTKQFHASGWEFTRNDAFDARNYFNPSPKPIAMLRFHTYGFNAGGQVPVWKSHPTFFFYNMEWRSLIQGGLTNQTVPDTAWYQGVFPSSIPITVPKTSDVAESVLAKNCPGGVFPAGIAQNTPFPNNTIPACMLDPNSQSLLTAGIFPANNSVDSNGHPTFIGGNNSPTKVREEVVRIDHQFNDKFSVFGHFVSEQISQTFGTSMWSGDNVPTAANTFGNPSYSGVIHLTHVISPVLLNEVAFNYNGNRINIVPTNVVARPSGFVSTELFDGNNLNRIPEIHLTGATGTDYTTASWPWHNKADDYQIRDDISWTKGAHQIKMGGSWAIYKKIQDLFGNTQGSFNFKGGFSGSDVADFLLGTASDYTELAVQDHGFWNNVSWAAYVQDNWRTTKRLTLNLGLRWDGAPHTYEANNRMGNFYPELYDPAKAPVFVAGTNGNAISPTSPGLGTSPNPVLAGQLFYLNGIGVPGQNGIPKGLVDSNWAAFGPRLGFAYDLTGSGKTILRGGFGSMYERIQGNDMYNAGPNIPFSTQVSFNNVTLENPATALASGNTLTAPITVASITGLDRQQNKLPVSYQYSIGVQRSLSTKSVLSVSYVGNQNRHQNNYREINAPDPSQLASLTANNTDYNTLVKFPGFKSIRMSRNDQNSHYNSLQAEIHSQVGRDLTLQAAYTLSRAIDPATNSNGVGDLTTVSNPYSYTYNYGPSGLDRTHNAFVNFVYDIPFLRNNSSRLLKSTVGGWQISGIVTVVTGNPLGITENGIGYDINSNTGNVAPNLQNATNRPNINGNVSYPKTAGQWFDPSVFTHTAAGEFGNLPFNSIRGPGRQNWNMALFKSFVLNEERGSRIELRAEAFNVWNHTQFNNVSSGVSFDQNFFLPGPPANPANTPNPNFGKVNNDFGRVTTAHDPRELQLGVKVYF
jgi:hypothetical protein